MPRYMKAIARGDKSFTIQRVDRTAPHRRPERRLRPRPHAGANVRAITVLERFAINCLANKL